jgi:hypothetical protein
MGSKPTMSSEEATEFLPYSVEHINLLCRQGKIKAKKPFGRWILDAEDVKRKAGIEEEAEVLEVKEASGEQHEKDQPKGDFLDI